MEEQTTEHQPDPVYAVDFESFYDSKVGYSLTDMDAYAYVHDPRFDAYLMSVVDPDGEEFVGSPRDYDWSKMRGKHLIAHNAGFDGMVLNRLIELGIVPEFERVWDCTADLAAFLCVPRSLKNASRELLGVEISKKVRSDMDGKSLRDLDPVQRQALLDYAADDARLCKMLWDRYSAKWPEIEREISRANRAAGWLGVHCNRKEVVEGLEKMRGIQAEAAKGLPWFDPASPKESKKAGSKPAFVMHAQSLGLPVPKSIKKDDPEMMAWVAKYADQYPFIRARLDYASVTVNVKRLESMLERMDREDILRFTSLYFGAHCLSGDHEVLTREGWVRLDQWHGGEIMQWKPTGDLAFRPATANTFANTEKRMVEFDAPYIKARMSLGHTVPFFRWRGAERVFDTKKAENFPGIKSQTRLPVAGIYQASGQISAEQMRVLVATQADGSFAKPYGELIFTLRKQRKIDRIQQLLSAAGVKHRLQYFPSSPTQARISVAKRDLPVWLSRERKVFGPWLLDSSAEARAAFVEEFPMWDGNTTARTTPNGVRIVSREYYTSLKQNIDWVQTVLHLTGKSSGKICQRLTPEDRAPAYRLSVREVPYAEINGGKAQAKFVEADSKIYCPSTETGYFLYRYKGVVAITGNTGRSSGGYDKSDADTGGGSKWNFYNQPKGDKDTGLTFGVDVRGLLTPRPGYVFGIWDFCQIEPRVVQWMSGHTEFLDLVTTIGNIYEADAVQSHLWDPSKGKLKKGDPRLYASSKERVIGLGFGMGSLKFLLTCRKKNVDIGCLPKAEWDLDRRLKFLIRNQTKWHWDNPACERDIGEFIMADRLVRNWRQTNRKVMDLHQILQEDLSAAAERGEKVHEYELASGRIKPFFNPHFSCQFKIVIDPDTGAESTKAEKRLYASVTKGMHGDSLHGGVITENLVQATARDIMFWGAMDVVKDARKWSFIGNVYDEVIFELPRCDAKAAEEVIPHFLCHGSSSSWTKGLPLEVEGGIRERYEK